MDINFDFEFQLLAWSNNCRNILILILCHSNRFIAIISLQNPTDRKIATSSYNETKQ